MTDPTGITRYLTRDTKCEVCGETARQIYVGENKQILLTVCRKHDKPSPEVEMATKHLVVWSEDLVNAKTGASYDAGYVVALSHIVH